MVELRKPMIMADRLMVKIRKAVVELTESEMFFIEGHPDSILDERDIPDCMAMVEKLNDLYNSLQQDLIRGDTGLSILKSKIFKEHYRLMEGLMATQCFPETAHLEYLCDADGEL